MIDVPRSVRLLYKEQNMEHEREKEMIFLDHIINQVEEKVVTLQAKYDKRRYTQIKRHGRTD